MAVSQIEPLWGTVTALTITAASLASSTTGVGRQTTMIDNTTTRYGKVNIAALITVGTSPTASRAIYFYRIGSNKDTTAIRDDSAGASDAGWTVQGARLLRWGYNGSAQIPCGAAASNAAFRGNFIFDDATREFGVGLVHDTGVALNATAGNHVMSYYGENPEAQ